MARDEHKPRGCTAAVGLRMPGRVASGVRPPVHAQPAQLFLLSRDRSVRLVPRPLLTPPSHCGQHGHAHVRRVLPRVAEGRPEGDGRGSRTRGRAAGTDVGDQHGYLPPGRQLAQQELQAGNLSGWRTGEEGRG
jgi:hypothetical protein